MGVSQPKQYILATYYTVYAIEFAIFLQPTNSPHPLAKKKKKKI